MRLAPSIMLALLLGASCGSRSEDEIQEEFDIFVEQNNQCATADDCVLVGSQCPLGCWVPVNESRVDAVKDKARQLIRDYESSGSSCDYGCTQPGTPTCEAGHCRAEPYDGQGDGGPAPVR